MTDTTNQATGEDAGQATGIKAVYRSVGIYDAVLPPHYYHGGEDVDLVGGVMAEHYGPPRREFAVAEFGCGTGRVTARLAPYARRLTAIDSSPAMLDTFRARFPHAEIRCADTRRAAAQMLDKGLAGQFDLVGAFWSLSYPLGDCFEEMTAEGIRPVADRTGALRQARQLVRDLVSLVADNGHLLALYFDSETREQRLVTRAWETIAPFPEGGRGYTRHLLLEELRAAEDRGRGWLTHTRIGGVALAANKDAARAWFNHLHFKNMPALVNDPEIQAEVEAFVDDHTQSSGDVILPSGVHVIDFHATDDPHHHIPRAR
ncbi:class I SAM-dependent methyltransferase [Actinokineospora sp.]|uniref:class I SAM-dependent methyltransferase n=1 Tax=Actinokineospora sp. TaxID=1872133 RepID=UPI004037AE76